MANITYKSDNFPLEMGAEYQGVNTCTASWAEIIWSAITVGKKNKSHVFRFRKFSAFEILYRLS